MYTSISVYQLFWTFTETSFQSVCLFDLNTGTEYYKGTMEDYDGPDFEISSIDCLVPDLVDEDGNPILVVNIDTNDDE